MIRLDLFKKSFYFFLFFTISLDAYTQSGIFFQAIARDINTNPARDRKIHVQTNIIQTTTNGEIVLVEEHQTNTDAFGVFSIMVGNGVRVGGSVTGISKIDWANGPYYLNIKIAITPIAASNTWAYSKEWIDLGTTIFGTVPFALYSASTAKINDKLNISDTSKMLEPYAKLKTVQVLSSTIESKLDANDTSVMLGTYSRIAYVDSVLSTKLSLLDTIKYTKLKYTDSALVSKMSLFDTSRFVKQIFIDSALRSKFDKVDTIKFAKQTYIDSVLQTKLSLNDNALTATIAGNITATTNTSITSLTNLNTVGTITSGIWSATAIDVAHGGTGLTTPGLPGQALTTTTTGTLTWTNVSILTGAHYIGESYGGGIVFYVYDNGKHGLIVSAEDQSTGGVNWYNGTYSTTNAVRDGINAGLMNTERIIISQGAGNYAAQIAANYKAGGYGDWYLPSAYELGLLHLQRELFFTGANVIFYYYSSNEHPSNNRQVMCYRFTSTLYSSYLDKLNTQVRVRAIRAF
jgi:hypothetical protein